MWAPSPRHQLRGITRARVLALCQEHGIPCRETDFYLTQVGRVHLYVSHACFSSWPQRHV